MNRELRNLLITGKEEKLGRTRNQTRRMREKATLKAVKLLFLDRGHRGWNTAYFCGLMASLKFPL